MAADPSMEERWGRAALSQADIWWTQIVVLTTEVCLGILQNMPPQMQDPVPGHAGSTTCSGSDSGALDDRPAAEETTKPRSQASALTRIEPLVLA